MRTSRAASIERLPRLSLSLVFSFFYTSFLLLLDGNYLVFGYKVLSYELSITVISVMKAEWGIVIGRSLTGEACSRFTLSRASRMDTDSNSPG